MYDTVAIKDEEVILKIEIRERFAKKGGELVEIFIDGKSIGKALSGIDGYAFKYYKPKRVGATKIFVKSSTESSFGVLLVLPKKSRVFLVEFEEGLLENRLFRFGTPIREGSQQAIKEINKKYPVIILQSGLLSEKFIKDFLRKHGFIDLAVIPCKRGECFEMLLQKGLLIKAVVGSGYNIESNKRADPLIFSFEEKESSIYVDDWNDIKRIILSKQKD
ncbi:MAG: hypothetical protein N2511_01435 [Thermodesulfovibrionales bacterium]|nr:hypothetical protein [Thermodesulfovibrionales bacterium]